MEALDKNNLIQLIKRDTRVINNSQMYDYENASLFNGDVEPVMVEHVHKVDDFENTIPLNNQYITRVETENHPYEFFIIDVDPRLLKYPLDEFDSGSVQDLTTTVPVDESSIMPDADKGSRKVNWEAYYKHMSNIVSSVNLCRMGTTFNDYPSSTNGKFNGWDAYCTDPIGKLNYLKESKLNFPHSISNTSVCTISLYWDLRRPNPDYNSTKPTIIKEYGPNFMVYDGYNTYRPYMSF